MLLIESKAESIRCRHLPLYRVGHQLVVSSVRISFGAIIKAMYLIAVILVIVVIDGKEQIISNKKLLSCGGGPSCQPIIPERNIAKKNAVTVQEAATIWQVVDGKQ